MNHVANRLQRYLDGELPREQAAQVAAHLDVCDRCRAECAALGALWREVDDAAPAPWAAALWPAVAARAQGRPRSGAGAPWLRGGLAVAALAAGLVLGLAAERGAVVAGGEAADAEFLREPASLDQLWWTAGGTGDAEVES